MKGMTPEEYGNVLSFVQKHHKFGWVPPDDRIKPNQFMWIKYVDACWDTRDMSFWCVTFRQGTMGVCFRTNHWTALSHALGQKPPYDSLFELCMAYLKYEFAPTKEYFTDEDTPNPSRPIHGITLTADEINGADDQCACVYADGGNIRCDHYKNATKLYHELAKTEFTFAEIDFITENPLDYRSMMSINRQRLNLFKKIALRRLSNGESNQPHA